MSTVLKVLGAAMGVLMMGVGCWCMLHPGMTYLSLGWALGACMLLDGVGGLATYGDHRRLGLADGWTLAGAVISIVVGVVLLASEASQLALDILVAYLASVWLTVLGVVRIVNAVRLRGARKEHGGELGRGWGWVLALGVMLVLCGIMAFLHPIVMALALGAMLGTCVIVAGANLVALAIA